MKVLYLNHTGLMSGAERSLLELVGALPADVSGLVASPEGPFAAAAREAGSEVARVPAAEASLRLHPLHTPLALGGLLRAALATARLARRRGADLVHANSVRAGLVAAAARRLGGPPVLVYVHDCLPDSRPANLTRRAILSSGGIVVANSRYTAANFAGDGGARTVYYGMVDADGALLSLSGRRPPERTQSRERLAPGARGPLVGLVAQITPWKGQDTAIEALGRLRERHPGARLLLVGEAKFLGGATRFDNAAYLDGLLDQVARLGLGEAVSFLGERRDALEIIAGLDVLVAPSWEEPFGRTIVEAIALGTPVVATAVGGPAEIVEDGVTGRLVEPRDPGALADVLIELLDDADGRARMADAAALAVRRFGLAQHVEGILAAYSDLLAGARP